MRYVLVAGLFAGLASAGSFTYSDFSSVAGLTLNGDTAQSGNVLRLVPSLPSQGGTAYHTAAEPWSAGTSFSTAFEFLVTSDPNSALGATDGFTFLLQNQGVNALGAAGQGSGYAGVSPSVAVSFRGRGPSYIGVLTNGADPGAGAPAGATVFGTDGAFYDQDFFAWIDYNPSTLSLSVFLDTTSTKPAAPIMTTTVDVFGTVGPQAFVGFSAGNGGAFGSQDILNWSFNASAAPEPATAGILMLGLAALGVARRRIKR